MKDRLAVELGLRDFAVLDVLLHGLEDATAWQAEYSEKYSLGVTLKEYSAALDRLAKGLRKLKDNRGRPDVAQRSINKALDVLYAGAPALYHTDDFWKIIALARQTGWEYSPGGQSEFEHLARLLPRFNDRPAIAALLLRHVEYQLSQLIQPGKGGRRTDAKRYNEGMRRLEYWFKSALPDLTISASEKSVFYRYVAFWFSYYLSIEVSDPSRHIKALIDSKKNIIISADLS